MGRKHSDYHVPLYMILISQAATKKQKYEKICEKKMSTPVEVLCRVSCVGVEGVVSHCATPELCRAYQNVVDSSVLGPHEAAHTTIACLLCSHSISYLSTLHRDSLQNLPCTSTIAAVSDLKRRRITCTCGSYFESSSAPWTTSTTIPLTGHCSNRKLRHQTRGQVEEGLPCWGRTGRERMRGWTIRSQEGSHHGEEVAEMTIIDCWWININVTWFSIITYVCIYVLFTLNVCTTYMCVQYI